MAFGQRTLVKDITSQHVTCTTGCVSVGCLFPSIRAPLAAAPRQFGKIPPPFPSRPTCPSRRPCHDARTRSHVAPRHIHRRSSGTLGLVGRAVESAKRDGEGGGRGHLYVPQMMVSPSTRSLCKQSRCEENTRQSSSHGSSNRFEPVRTFANPQFSAVLNVLQRQSRIGCWFRISPIELEWLPDS